MNFVIADDIPFTIVWKVLVEVEIVLVLIIFAVEITPLTLEVRVFVAEEILFPVITVVVPIDPPIFEVKIFPDTD